MATDRYSDDHKIVVSGGNGTLTIDATLDAANISSANDINIESDNDINIESTDGDVNLTTNNHDINLTTNNGVVSIDGMNIYRDSLLSHHIDYPVEIIWHSDHASNTWIFDQNTSFLFLNDSTYYNLSVSTNNLYLSSRDDVYIKAGIDAANSTLWLSANGNSTPYIEMLKDTDRINIYGGTSHISAYSGAIYANAGGQAYLTIGPEVILMAGNHPTGGAGIDEQIVDIFNASNNNDSDVLYLSIGYTSDATPANNFIVFFDHGLNSNDIGSIEGDGAGGISLNSGGADYAEWIMINQESEWPEYSDLKGNNILGIPEGTLVWISDSKIHRNIVGTPMIITKRAIVCGNSPKNSFRKESSEIGERVSFIGQVPVIVEGPVKDGDYLLPKEGSNHCFAVDKAQITFEQYKSCVGTAWGSSNGSQISKVNCAIGIK